MLEDIDVQQRIEAVCRRNIGQCANRDVDALRVGKARHILPQLDAQRQVRLQASPTSRVLAAQEPRGGPDAGTNLEHVADQKRRHDAAEVPLPIDGRREQLELATGILCRIIHAFEV